MVLPLGAAAVVLVLVLLGYVLLFHRTFSNLPPGPKPYPLIGNLLSIFKFTFWFAGARSPVISINDPVLAAKVLSDKETYKSRPGVGWESFIPNSLLILPTNDRWSFHRRMLTPAFSEKYLKSYFNTVRKKTKQCLVAWAAEVARSGPENEVEAHGAFTALTLDVIGLAGFGQDFGCLENPECYFSKAGNILSHEAVNRFYQPSWMWSLDRERANSFMKAMDYYTTLVHEIMDKKHATDAEQTTVMSSSTIDESGGGGDADDESANDLQDILSVMVNARDKQTQQKLSPKELTDQILTFLLAGHETTSNTLAWAFHLLSTSPEVQEKVVQEREAVGAARRKESAGSADDELDFEDMQKLSFTKCVVFEALRLYPTLSRIMRKAENTAQLGDYTVPRNAVMRISLIGMGHSQKIWGEDADEFKPERFNDDKFLASWAIGGKNIPGGRDFAFLPFGAGPRTCMGKRFALLETTYVISTALSRFQVAPAPGHGEVEMVSDITMGPKKGLHLRLVPRERSGPVA